MNIDNFVSYCKRRGLVFPSSEIYGGYAGFYDYGPVGVEMKNNIEKAWWRCVVHSHHNIYGLDTSIIMNPDVWKASGHVDRFIDYLTVCEKCGTRYKADQLVGGESLTLEEINTKLKSVKCPKCGGKLSSVKEFNTMMKVNVGDEHSYIRPETAQGMFVNFLNVVKTMRAKLPFGIAQIGKSFRNEISPRNFLFRLREFTQAELEFFFDKEDEPNIDLDFKLNVLTDELQVKGQDAVELSANEFTDLVKYKWHAYWILERYKWYLDYGIRPDNLRVRKHLKEELSHYAIETWDIEYKFPFGWKELEGVANRGDYDLLVHEKHSGVGMVMPETKVRPMIVEPSAGVDRMFLAFLVDAYREEVVNNEKRVVLSLDPRIAAYQVAVFPLVNKDGLDTKAEQIFKSLLGKFNVVYDKSGSIGRRYRRQDEIGTPYCITIDYDTLRDDTVTIRDRDSMNQVRVRSEDLVSVISKLISKELSFNQL
ncbi:glycine--tRNA ligase [Nanoarchaeota archaeon]|nr:MAG: glycine--tRNA ligase [Nanoarchaeota archaeon]